MDEKTNRRESLSNSLSLVGLSLGMAALMASGGLAIVTGAIGFAFLVGSMAVSILPETSPSAPSWPACAEAAVSVEEPDTGPAQEAGHHWRQSVAASRSVGRRR